MRRHIWTLLKLAIGLGLMAFVLSRVDLPVVLAKLSSANGWLVGLGVLLFWGAMSINAFKWWTLMRAQGLHPPFASVLNFTFVGFFFNNILPANIGGDVMRGLGLARDTERTAASAASVVLDRLIGLSAYMTVAAVAALITVYVTDRTELTILAWVAVIAVATLASVMAALLSRRLRRLGDRVIQGTFLRPLTPIWLSASQAFEVYRFSHRTLFAAFGIGLSGIFTTSLVNYTLSESLGGGIPLLHVFLFTPLIALVLIVPISIGGLGLNQVAYPFFFGLVGVSYEHAVSLSLFIQAVQIFCSLPGGLLWLRWRRRDSAPSSSPLTPPPQPQP
ncbi:MAG: flippase-like domain-containing protein [Chloroflexi bacterium]|nr:flippase-like domain-containing protein [Chloroflexota bacterium]